MLQLASASADLETFKAVEAACEEEELSQTEVQDITLLRLLSKLPPKKNSEAGQARIECVDCFYLESCGAGRVCRVLYKNTILYYLRGAFVRVSTCLCRLLVRWLTCSNRETTLEPPS